MSGDFGMFELGMNITTKFVISNGFASLFSNQKNHSKSQVMDILRKQNQQLGGSSYLTRG